jgi:putative transposase
VHDFLRHPFGSPEDNADHDEEAPATEARGSFSADDVIDVLNRMSRSHRKPAVIQVDNGTEFASRALDAHVFESLEDAEETLTSWRSDYNAVRPHSALGMLTPREFAEFGQRNSGR